MPSASKMTRQLLGRPLTILGKKFCMYLSLPRPGPITQQWMAFSQDFSFQAQWSSILAYYSTSQVSYSREMKRGCVIISGEYDFIAGELNFEQKM